MTGPGPGSALAPVALAPAALAPAAPGPGGPGPAALAPAALDPAALDPAAPAPAALSGVRSSPSAATWGTGWPRSRAPSTPCSRRPASP